MKRIYAVALIASFFILSGLVMYSGGYEVGDKARDFDLKNVDGQQVSMKANPDNLGYIIVFTCNTCPWARGYEQRIIDLHNQFANKGYPVIAIQPNDPEIAKGDSYEEMQKRAETYDYPFPYLVDEGQEVTLAYGATKTPHVFLVQKQGEDYLVRYIGGIDDSPRDGSKVQEPYVANAVNALLTDKPVQVTSTKAIGCSIKWSKESEKKRESK